jgi:hypothetical protein
MAAGLILACAAIAAESGPGQVPVPTPALPAGVPADWWQRAQSHIRASEYRWSWRPTPWPDTPQAWQAPNRAHNIRTYLGPDGFRMVPRTGDTQVWEWGLRLTGYGAAGALGAVPPGEIAVNGPRAELFRGPLTEWYVNDERGLEQGFSLEDPPVLDPTAPSPPTGAIVALELAVTGTLQPAPLPGGIIEFRTAAGEAVMRFGGLKAQDDTGRELPVRLELVERGQAPGAPEAPALRITVDAAGACYPICVDPLAWAVAGLKE